MRTFPEAEERYLVSVAQQRAEVESLQRLEQALDDTLRALDRVFAHDGRVRATAAQDRTRVQQQLTRDLHV